MRVCFFCGYYPDRAHKQIKPRTEDYWNAYFYVWAVKVGAWKKDFYILKPGRLNITKANFSLVRKTFGEWAAQRLATFTGDDIAIVPVPSKDGLVDKGEYRSLKMAKEAFAQTDCADAVLDGLRWMKAATKAHEGGSRKRAALLPLLKASPSVNGRDIILVDELFSTGGSLLACGDALTAAGGKVLGAITLGKTIYDFKTPPFGSQEFELTQELSDWPFQ